jgi:hypothetical protein
MKRGLSGAKPERVCHWLFAAMGLRRTDELHDLYHGSGAVKAAWDVDDATTGSRYSHHQNARGPTSPRVSPEGATARGSRPLGVSGFGSAWRVGRAGVSARDTTRRLTRAPAV